MRIQAGPHLRTRTIAILLVGVFIAACNLSASESLGADQAESPPSNAEPPPIVTETFEQTPATTEVEIATEEPVVVTEEPVPTLPPSPIPPTPREDLVATNLSTVDLASGKPTLVEFFAFW